MIPLAIEPAWLCFDLRIYPRTNLPDEQFQDEFSQFVGQLQKLFAELQDKDLGVIASRDVVTQIYAYVPLQAYYDNALARLANEAFLQRLKNRLIYIQPKHLGGHSVDFDTSIVRGGVYTHDFYSVWTSMFAVCLEAPVIAGILSAPENSIFTTSPTAVVSTSGDVASLVVAATVQGLSSSPSADFHRLIDLKNTSVTKEQIPCRGTGTHSSMWGHAIRDIEDVPVRERELLNSIIRLGVVKEITFLDFPKRVRNVGQPELHIDEAMEGTDSDSLICTLYGQGAKQNCQRLRLDVTKGTAGIVRSAFSDVITTEKIEVLSHVEEIASR